MSSTPRMVRPGLLHQDRLRVRPRRLGNRGSAVSGLMHSLAGRTCRASGSAGRGPCWMPRGHGGGQRLRFGAAGEAAKLRPAVLADDCARPGCGLPTFALMIVGSKARCARPLVPAPVLASAAARDRDYRGFDAVKDLTTFRFSLKYCGWKLGSRPAGVTESFPCATVSQGLKWPYSVGGRHTFPQNMGFPCAAE